MWPFAKTPDLEHRLKVKQEHESFIKAYDEILVELFADRGMLLGTSRYDDMTGVERFDALNEIDTRILKVKDLKEQEEQKCKQNSKYS